MDVIYLVTGATGHLGNTIIKKLLTNQKQIRAFVLSDDIEIGCLPEEVEIFQGNIMYKPSLIPFFSGLENKKVIVIHTAGIVSISSKSKEPIYDVNVNGTKNIIEFCTTNLVEKLIYVSSVHALPEVEQGKAIVEAYQFNPENVLGLYAKTKAEATALVFEAVSKGLNACVVFPSGICGPFDYQNSNFTQLFKSYYKGKLKVGVKGGYDFVDVRDVAEGIILCCEKGKNGDGYIFSNKYLEMSEVFQMFSNITGGRKIKITLPIWFAQGIAGLAERYDKLLKQTSLYTPYSIYTLQTNSNFSHEKASKELGYSIRPFEETIKDMFDWLRSENKL